MRIWYVFLIIGLCSTGYSCKKKSCPSYSSSFSSSRKMTSKSGLEPWSRKAKKQNKRKPKSGLTPR